MWWETVLVHMFKSIDGVMKNKTFKKQLGDFQAMSWIRYRYPHIYCIFLIILMFYISIILILIFVFTDTLSASCFFLILWTSFHLSLIVSRMFSQRIPCLLLKYASNGIRFIGMNVDRIWTVHLIKLHIPNWNCVTVLNLRCSLHLGPSSTIYGADKRIEGKNYSCLYPL